MHCDVWNSDKGLENVYSSKALELGKFDNYVILDYRRILCEIHLLIL